MSFEMLSADDIWAAHDIREEVVPVPEWGGSVKVRALTLKQIAAVAQAAVRRNARTGLSETDNELLMTMTLIEGMVEPKLSMADATRLQAKSASVITRIVQVINALGTTEEAIGEATKSDAPKLNGQVPILAGARVEDDPSGPY